jgi:hypothetical protein
VNKIHLFCFHSVVEKDPHWDNFGKHLLKGRPIMLTIRPIMAKELARFKELEGKCHYIVLSILSICANAIQSML